MNAAIKNYLKLLNYFDPNDVKICLPTKNDFGEMSKDDFIKWKKKLTDVQSTNQVLKILEVAKKLKSEKKLPKTLFKNLSLIE
jgi:hypothetical protein